MAAGRLRALLALAAAGAALVIVRFLPTAVEAVGVLAMVVATALTAPAPGDSPAELRWWRLVGLGVLISIVAVPLSLLLGTIGGLLAGAGGALVIVGVVFGWPEGDG